MADHFRLCNCIVPLPTEEAVQYALHLDEQACNITDESEIPAGFPESLKDVWGTWSFNMERMDRPEGPARRFQSVEGVEAACAFIQHLLQRFNPKGHVALAWSAMCTNPWREGAFGGGAAVITAEKVEEIWTDDWLVERVAKLETTEE